MALNFPINPSVGQVYSPGELKLHNTVVNVDKDYVTFVTGSDPITAIYLTKYVGVDQIAFFAIQAGTAWTVGQDITQMVAYGHLGPGAPGFGVGDNILAPQNATLSANTAYTMWIQQTGSNLTEYVLSTDAAYTGEDTVPADYSSNALAPTTLGTLTGTKSWVWTGATWTVAPKTNPTFSSIIATGSVTAPTLVGNLTGNVTGNTTGTHTGAVVGNVTGNVLGNTTGTHTGAVVGNVTGNITGNAITATSLQTSRTINGVAFNGTENITVTANASTLTGTSLNSSVTGSNLTSVGTLSTLSVSGDVTVNNGITATGNITANSNVIITNAPTATTHATNKQYVDTRAIAFAVGMS